MIGLCVQQCSSLSNGKSHRAGPAGCPRPISHKSSNVLGMRIGAQTHAAMLASPPCFEISLIVALSASAGVRRVHPICQNQQEGHQSRALIIVLSLMAIGLSGCQTFDEMSPEEKQALVQQKGENCGAFGHKPGTPAFAQCIQGSIQDHDRGISRQRAASASSNTVCSVDGDTLICFQIYHPD